MLPVAAPGAIRTCDAVLQSMVPRITVKLGSPVLPTVEGDALFCFLWRSVFAGSEVRLPRVRAGNGTAELRKTGQGCSGLLAYGSGFSCDFQARKAAENWGVSEWPQAGVRPRLE